MSALLEKVRSRTKLPSRAVAIAIREEAGITQAELAEALGVHVTSVARWECGMRRPRGHFATAYSDLLQQIEREIGR